MAFKNVVVAGGGVLGSQIAYQTAFRGFQTTIWLRSEESITRTQPKLDRLHSIYLAELNAAKSTLGNPNASYSRGLITDPQNLTIEKIDELIQKAEDAYKNLRLEVDMAKAVSDADLVIESMAENPQDKIAFYSKLADLLPAHTIVATNSSSMVPSAFRDYTKRPEKYLAIHFANNIWRSNTAEIMGHDTTSPEAFEAVAEFAAQIAMVP
ncbi:MAG TPA: 3-hydroxyacyl-CoA dehydrogenase NAD-binding domain-containing protein, partial [Lachnospiraceae bacterium]